MFATVFKKTLKSICLPYSWVNKATSLKWWATSRFPESSRAVCAKPMDFSSHASKTQTSMHCVFHTKNILYSLAFHVLGSSGRNVAVLASCLPTFLKGEPGLPCACLVAGLSQGSSSGSLPCFCFSPGPVHYPEVYTKPIYCCKIYGFPNPLPSYFF